MTEQEWIESIKPHFLLDFLRNSKASERKARLFACACIRRIWHFLPSEASRLAVEVAERHAEGLAGVKELEAASTEAYFAKHDPGSTHDIVVAELAHSAVQHLTDPTDLWDRVFSSSDYAREVIGGGPGNQSSDQALQCHFLRDIFGNPFHPVALNPAWQTTAVAALVQAAYENRTLPGGTLEPDRLAVLADALEDAGCTEAAILEHLRGPGPHWRGCWVIDALLGKT